MEIYIHKHIKEISRVESERDFYVHMDNGVTIFVPFYKIYSDEDFKVGMETILITKIHEYVQEQWEKQNVNK